MRGEDPQLRKLEASLASLRGAAREYAASRGRGSATAAARGAGGTVSVRGESGHAPEAARAGLSARLVARLRALGRKLMSWR